MGSTHGRAMPIAESADGDARRAVLGKAVLRAADRMGLSQRELAECLGVSEATVSRFKGGETSALTRKPFELAALLVRVYRSVDALMGGDESSIKTWLRAENRHLSNRVPAELVQRIDGLFRVAEYLDFMRGAQ